MSGDLQQGALARRMSSTRQGMTDRPRHGRLRVDTAGPPGVDAASDLASDVAIDSTRGPGPGVGAPISVMSAVHVALHHLVVGCRAERLPLPIVPRLIADEHRVEAHLAAPFAGPPQPWTTHGQVWSLDVDALPAESDAASWDAYPALVYLGSLEERWVFADLGAAPGLVEVDGPADEVSATLARLARALGEAPWSRGVEVVAVGADASDGADLRAALGDVGPEVSLGGVSGRWGSPPRETHRVVLCAQPLGADERRLVRAASRHRGAPTVVAPQGEQARGVWRWQVEPGVSTW